MPSTEKECIEVDSQEIVFFKENQPTAFFSLICESLAEKGVKVSRQQVRQEIVTMKKSHSKVIIEEARRLLKAIKGVEYSA